MAQYCLRACVVTITQRSSREKNIDSGLWSIIHVLLTSRVSSNCTTYQKNLQQVYTYASLS